MSGSVQSSAEISRAIYQQLRADGLAARTTPHWDDRTVRRILDMTPPNQRVLDVGCGYGRIAVPLAEAGHRVTGIDICQHMLDETRQRAERAGMAIDLHLGDMCRLPFADASFDVALCLWLTFHELLQAWEQLAAVREMVRVLRPGGWALVDGPPYCEEFEHQAAPRGSGVAAVDSSDPVAVAFGKLLAQAAVADHEIYIDDCPGRPRYFLRFTTRS